MIKESKYGFLISIVLTLVIPNFTDYSFPEELGYGSLIHAQ